ncbi:MAG: phosphoribosylaminoimidazolesuccinocarboxamide synthase [Chloroflexi bacterium]|nr:phosphoribosylaminoimidazolesuccinocarboxamide synthase [Chloroflexota bacterium]MCI0847212.1 phosphoribosylaminoimidazolesuccinocarboxamide synthase [Chloroflexota bacterium]MCI0897039.1 phosphoribosylaminoimidazolesuccinocarboxamide synthase [Chloroflexota bacterium]MCI0899644.1 phosphoribosylaminoimidazolesuccinocarboxamide synthase [Chloroflexota bacterium]MCI0902469.1 phosphoribosylaminoimidazolesuccinocarboxamide synthase [Chloroflexota bacterium]
MLMETQMPDILHRGKVRDTYALGGGHLLMVATDRISAFDVVLPTGITDKGLVLNRISAFWFERTKDIVPNHFICLADAPEAAQYLEGSSVAGEVSEEVARQAMVVKQAERLDIECIVRGYITGSAWSEYRRQGTVSGMDVGQGLVEGQAFPEPLFTPTTKAEVGHDENMSKQEVLDLVGAEMARQLEDTSKAVYKAALDYAKGRGIILADTKMEFGIIDGELTLIDELLTPDSSRFWDATGYAPGKSQPNYDKQFVRDWLDSQGWDHEPPAPELPNDVVAKTSERYREAYYKLTGTRL